MTTSVKQKTAAIIVAAGRGERMGLSDGPKQYRDLGGKSVLARTLSAFIQHDQIDLIIVAIHQDDGDLYHSATTDHSKLLPPVIGGATRQLSVLAGLNGLVDLNVDRVLIHDAARPFVDHRLISNTIAGLLDNKAALPALAVADTLKRSNDNEMVNETVSREDLFSAQTPQGFDYQSIMQAHHDAEMAGKSNFTDDAALAEWANIPVKLVEGSARNVKITTPVDLQHAQEKFEMYFPDVRVGHGYDTHQLVPGNSVWLCGVELPHTHALSGHSDADVGLHALTDALLSTVADGDIGSHFPPSDPKWKGARSDRFLKHAVERVTAAGGRITHMDVTLVCEAPKIGPHRDRMRQAISDISDVDVSRISVKATTNEKIGFVGRNEGMVALATATVVIGNTL